MNQMVKKGQDLTGKSMKFREIKEIMTQPSMKAQLSSYVDEAVKSKKKIQFEQDTLKGLRDNARDQLGLKPAIFNQYVAMVLNNDYLQRKDKLEELIDMIDYVMEDADAQLVNPNRDGDD